MRRIILGIIAAGSIAAPAWAGELEGGMSRREVVRVMGPPDAVRLERNGVVCLTYAVRWHALLARTLGGRTRIVALKDDGLVAEEVVRADAVRKACGDIAGRWDAPDRGPLICDARWRRGC